MTVYNKLFTKILDSSIWLASDTTRLVWITMIAAMDEDGFCPFATVDNLAARARVELKAAKKAVNELESPEPATATFDNDGRRIERVPGGWIVLNAGKYRKMVTRIVQREQTKERVRRHRAKLAGNDPVTQCNAPPLNVTPSEAVSDAEAGGKGKPPSNSFKENQIQWEGKWWFPDKLQKQAEWIEKEIVGKDGEEFKILKAKLNSVKIALGVKLPKSSKPKVVASEPVRPPPTPEEGKLLADALRKAVDASA